MTETALTFACEEAELLGILHHGTEKATRGVVIVVGGPQYRVGSHRQFLLLARELAAAGVPVLRFDYRGMGDSAGEPVDFEHVDPDLAAAIDVFFEHSPQLREVVIWGLCDAASAALFYAWQDPRVTGLVLLNPWVRTETTEARAYLRHYYAARLFSPELWRKVGRGEFDFAGATRSLLDVTGRALGKAGPANTGSEAPQGNTVKKMAQGLARFAGPVLVILSGDDLTAAEFKDTTQASPLWQRLLSEPRVTRRELPAANHTFARREWRDRVAQWTLQWLESW